MLVGCWLTFLLDSHKHCNPVTVYKVRALGSGDIAELFNDWYNSKFLREGYPGLPYFWRFHNTHKYTVHSHIKWIILFLTVIVLWEDCRAFSTSLQQQGCIVVAPRNVVLEIQCPFRWFYFMWWYSTTVIALSKLLWFYLKVIALAYCLDSVYINPIDLFRVQFFTRLSFPVLILNHKY